MKKIVSLLLVLIMVLSMAACGAAPAAAPEASTDVAMQYKTPEEAKELLNHDEYVFFDVRKAADSSAATIPGAQAWDMDAAKEGDAEAGKATMTEATKDLDKNLILVCYSGKRYAQATTNALAAIGYDMSKVYTLEGGFTAWSEKFPELVQKAAVEQLKDQPMQYIAPADAAAVIGNADYTIIDVRKEADSTAAHIPGALCIDMDAAKEGDFEAGVAAMTPVVENHDNNLILVCYSGKRYAQATTDVLASLGYDMSKVYTLEGGFTAWSEQFPGIVAPTTKVEKEMQYMTADEVEAVLDNADYTVIDVRKAADSSAATIPGSVRVDMDAAKEGDFEAGVIAMAPVAAAYDNNLVLVCYSGKRYAQATTDVLASLGYDMSKVYTLEGGFTGWSENKADLVVVPGAEETAESSAFEGKYVVDAAYVLANMNNENVILVDARGEDVAKEGTVEGAIAVIWQMFADVTSGVPGDPMWGTLLPAEQLSAVLSTTGISPEKEILVFGTNQFGWGDEGRIVWGLNAAGFENAKFVDGGYTALVAAGAPIVKGAAAYTPAEVTVAAIDETHIINTEALVADYDKYTIVDTRADEEWNGEVLYGEAAGGHLPKALHIRYTDLFNADETLKSNDEIMALFTEAGLTNEQTIVTYCTGGIRSAYMQLVLEMLGFENTLNYDESFYRWSACQDCE